MRFDPTRCASCGGPPLPVKSLLLSDDGRIARGDPFFFCSHDCFEREFDNRMPDGFSLSKGVSSDMEWQQLSKEYEAANERFEKSPRLYSNEEYQEQLDWCRSHLERMNQRKRDWRAEWERESLKAIATMRAVWHSHHAQMAEEELAKQRSREETERRKAEAKAEAERLAEQAQRDAFNRLVAPRPIPEHLRIHTAIIAKTGWGKTQFIQSLVLAELLKKHPPAMVILDSTGAMVDRIQRLAVFAHELRDRILIIDPAHSPALNMFDMSNPRFNTYSQEQREAVQTDVLDLFNYIFSSKDYDLSGQQGLGFAYAVRLILARKGYTVTHLRHLLEENPPRADWTQSRFADDIRQLDQDSREFFERHFFSESLRATKGAIARRLHSLIAIPTFQRMFTAGSNALDLYSETQEKGSIVLVNTNQQLLGRDGYVLFGRYIVARTFAAMLERAQIAQHERRTTHLIIDEAAPYFDDSFDDLLTQVRQYGLKVTIAFQHLDQLDDKLKNAVAGQTSVKYVGGLSPLDEKRVAAQIRCEPQFITDLAIDSTYPPAWSEWAVHVDGLTKHPMKLKNPFFVLEGQERMTDAEHAALIEWNKSRVSAIARPAHKTEVNNPKILMGAAEAGTSTLTQETVGRQPAPDNSDAGSTW